MAGKSFSVSFRINGAMDGSLQAALNAASNAMRGLGNSAKAASAAAQASKSGLAGMAAGLNQLSSAAQKFRELKKTLAESQTGLSAAQSAANSMAAQYRKDAAAAEQLRQKLAQLRAEQSKSVESTANTRALLQALRAERQKLKSQLSALGVSGKNIPRELLGTDKGRQAATLLTALTANKAALEEQRKKFREVRDEAKKLATSIRETQSALKTQEQTARQSGQGFEQAKAKAAALKAALQQQQEALQRLRTSLGSQGFSTASFAASERQLEAEINRVNAALQRQQQLMTAQRQSAQASQEMFNAYNNFQGALNTAQQIAEPFQSAAKTAIDFEHSMSRVKALTQSQNIREGNSAQVKADMELLTAQARELGATTMFTSKQAADAMGYLGMAGWKTQQIYGTMPGMLNLAAAAGADLAQTADIVSDNMTAMGVPVEKAGHFMDVYAYALTNSNARLTDFGETMKYAAPVAKAYGSSLDETAAMVMMMANAGIKGSMAGTSLRMGLLRLAGPPKTATKEMEKLGLSLSDAQAGALEADAVIKGLGIDLTGATTASDKMTRVLMQLHDKTKDLSQDEKLAAFKGIFGVNAETGWLALFDQGPEVFMKYLEGLRAADGYSAQVAETMNDDTQGALIRLESAWDAFKERTGETLTPTIKAVAESFAPLVTAAAQFVEANPAVVQAAAGIAAALTSIIVGAAAVKLAFAGWTFITSSITLVQAALASLGSGAMLGGLIAKVTALRTALFGLGGAATLGGWSTMFAAISTKAAMAATAIRGFFASLTLGSMASGIVATISSIGTAIAGAARAAMAFAFSPIGVALMALALAGLYCYQNWDKVAPVLSNIAGIITGALSAAFQTVMPAIQNFMSILGQLGESSALKELASVVGGTLVQAFTALLGIAATTIAVVIRGLGDLVKTVTDLGNGLMGAFYSFSEGNFDEGLSRLGETASKTVDNIKQSWAHAFDGALNGAKLTGEALDVLNGKVTVAQQNALRQAPSSAPQFDDPMMNAAQVAQPPIDTSATQAALDQVGNSAQNAATNMDAINQSADALNQFPAAIQPTADAMSQFGSSLQPVSAEAQNLATGMQSDTSSLQNHSTGLEANSSALQSNIGALNAFGTSAQGAVGSVTALGSASQGAAGAISGLGAAAQAACSQLAQAGANAAAAVSAAAANAGGGKVAANYQGGIYRKGAFLTTFAERAPEAAIPLDNSERARDLWTRAGQILGLIPGQATTGGFDTTPQAQILPQNSGSASPQKPPKIPQFPQMPKLPEGFSVMTPPFNPDVYKIPQSQTQIPPQRTRYYQPHNLPKIPQFPQMPKLPEGFSVMTPPFNPDVYKIPQIPQFPQMPKLPEGFSIMTPPTFPTAKSGSVIKPSALSEIMGKLPVLPPIIGDVVGGFLTDVTQEKNFSPIERPEQILPQAQSSSSEPPIFNFTINVTVNGNADENTIQRGVEAAIPSLEDWSRHHAAFVHEEARRSFL